MSETVDETVDEVEVEVEFVVCGNCGHNEFTEVMGLVKVPAAGSKSGRAGISPIGRTYVCMNCGSDVSETNAVKSLMEEVPTNAWTTK